MPTYEYQCSECGAIFDVFQSIKAAPLRKAHCMECGDRQPVKRLIGAGGAVIFKGSGFYQTDYRSESYKKKAEADKPSTGASEGAKSDAKPKASEKTKSDTKKSDKPAGKS